jgi:hypothetical protein
MSKRFSILVGANAIALIVIILLLSRDPQKLAVVPAPEPVQVAVSHGASSAPISSADSHSTDSSSGETIHTARRSLEYRPSMTEPRRSTSVEPANLSISSADRSTGEDHADLAAPLSQSVRYGVNDPRNAQLLQAYSASFPVTAAPRDTAPATTSAADNTVAANASQPDLLQSAQPASPSAPNANPNAPLANAGPQPAIDPTLADDILRAQIGYQAFDQLQQQASQTAR